MPLLLEILSLTGLDSASDLASVKRILDAAIQPFRSFPIDSSNLSGKSGEDSMDYSMDEEGKSKDLEEPPVLSPRNKGDNSSMQSDQDMPEIAESPEQFAKMVIRISFLCCSVSFIHCGVNILSTL